MKIISAILAALLPLAAAGEAIHEKYLSEPYPQQGDIICINPVPLKVPLSMMQTEFMQFQMSMDSHFEDSTVITSEPAAWNIFNAHKELAPGTWHWRFRGVSAGGEALPWSGTFTFSIAEDTPVFVTPPYDVFRKNIPAEKISEQASLSGDLNLCGVSLLVFLRLCEKEYNVRMPEETAFYAREFGYVLTNVGELATLLYEAVKKA